MLRTASETAATGTLPEAEPELPDDETLKPATEAVRALLGRARRRAPDHTRLTWMSHCLGAVAGDRGDLFAEVAGLALGTAEGRTPSTRPGQVVVDMCRAADADETLIPQWVAEGKRRAEAARMKPHGGEQRLAPRRP